MPQNLSRHIRECYRRADECRRSAETARTEPAKANFLETEGRWLALARSYEVSERLSAFVDAFQARRGHLEGNSRRPGEMEPS
jgi:hypothetical protein